MNDDELGRLLGRAFDAAANGAVDDHTSPPPPRFAQAAAPRPAKRFLAPLAAAAAVLLAVGVGVAVSRSGHDDNRNDAVAPPANSRSASLSGNASPSNSAPSTVTPSPTRPVAIRSASPIGLRVGGNSQPVGVGLPVVARFAARITDARALEAATTVTANGRPLQAAWYFVASTVAGYPVEGHLRPQSYWPAHARIEVAVKARSLSAGTGLSFANDLTLSFTTGAKTVATVDDRTHLLTVQSDGKPIGTSYHVSLGAAKTPTLSGVKVIMAKLPSVCMQNVNGAYRECGIRDAQQLTNSGEYLHAAPWNVPNIGVRNTSNGCTNLSPTDARTLYALLEVGDIVVYPSTSGREMAIGDGIGDWDVPWPTWLTGGLVPTR